MLRVSACEPPHKATHKQSRGIERLKDTQIRSAKLAPGLYHDGGGLYLQIKNGGRSWLLRYMLNRKARGMGLGSYPDVPLTLARELARKHKAQIATGVDPIAERQKERQAARAEAAKAITFERAALDLIGSKKAEWTNPKHAEQWEATLKTYAFPVIGKVSVQAVDTAMVVKILKPIWTTKTETASRVRQRIQAVLDSATAHKLRTGDNPARWQGHLDKILAKPTKVKKAGHFEAMPYAELPAFYKALRTRTNVSARALAFTILTAARSGETRFADFAEIDRNAKTWTIPGARTKSKRPHVVPLTDEMLELIGDGDANLIFANDDGKALSDAAMRKYLQDELARPTTTVHGFRQRSVIGSMSKPKSRARSRKLLWATLKVTKPKRPTSAVRR